MVDVVHVSSRKISFQPDEISFELNMDNIENDIPPSTNTEFVESKANSPSENNGK
eukprot:Pgem_evm1s15285